MKKYIRPTMTCISMACGQMIANSIGISGENATSDACGKGQTFDDFCDDTDYFWGHTYNAFDH